MNHVYICLIKTGSHNDDDDDDEHVGGPGSGNTHYVYLNSYRFLTYTDSSHIIQMKKYFNNVITMFM